MTHKSLDISFDHPPPPQSLLRLLWLLGLAHLGLLLTIWIRPLNLNGAPGLVAHVQAALPRGLLTLQVGLSLIALALYVLDWRTHRLTAIKQQILKRLASPVILWGFVLEFALAELAALFVATTNLTLDWHVLAALALVQGGLWMLVYTPKRVFVAVAWMLMLLVVNGALLNIVKGPQGVTASRGIFELVRVSTISLVIVLYSSGRLDHLFSSKLLLWGSLIVANVLVALLPTSLSPSIGYLVIAAIGLLWIPASGLLILPLHNRIQPAVEAPAFASVSTRIFRISFVVIILGYLVCAVFMAHQTQWDLNADHAVYFQIARSFAEGHPIVRGYWSPLMSLLLAIGMVSGLAIEVANVALMLIGGLVVIVSSVVLVRRLGVPRWAQLLTAISTAGVALTVGFRYGNPDSLSAAVMMLYFVIVSDPRFTRRPLLFGALSGLVGGMGYLAKYYNLPFVVLHLTLTFGLLIIHKRAFKPTIKVYAVALCALLITILPWVIAVRSRYGYFTITPSAELNYQKMVAVRDDDLLITMCSGDLICDKPDDVLLAWEDPRPMQARSVDNSAAPTAVEGNSTSGGLQLSLLKDQTDRFIQNFANMLAVFQTTLGLLPLFAMIALGLSLIFRQSFNLQWQAATVFLYLFGYLLLTADQMRYIYPVVPLIIGGVFYLLSKVSLTLRPSNLILSVALISVLVSMTDLSFLKFRTLKAAQPCVRDAAIALEPFLTAPTASSEWEIYFISFYTRIRTYGTLGSNLYLPDEMVDRLLRQGGVNTFLIADYNPVWKALRFKYGYPLLTIKRVCGLNMMVFQVPRDF